MEKISISEAKSDKLFYVVANVVLVDVAKRAVLLLKRGVDEKEASEQWGFPGGKAEHEMLVNGRVNDFLGVVALKEAREETGLTFEPADSIVLANGAFVRKDGIPVFWATLAAPYAGGNVVLEQGSFSESGWFVETDLPSAEECVGTVRDEAVLAIQRLCN